MKIPLARLARVPVETDQLVLVESPSERRREPRYAAGAAATLKSAQGDSDDVQLIDASMHGCSVQCDAGWLRIGRFVSISIEERPALEAVIRWLRDGTAGMEFLRPIPPDREEWQDLLDMPF